MRSARAACICECSGASSLKSEEYEHADAGREEENPATDALHEERRESGYTEIPDLEDT